MLHERVGGILFAPTKSRALHTESSPPTGRSDSTRALLLLLPLKKQKE